MRVLFVTAWYPDAAEPMRGIFIREHARAVALHHDVQVLHLVGAKRGLRPWRFNEERDPAITEGIPTFRITHAWAPSPARYLGFAASALGAMAHLSRRFRPDVIHAHVFRAATPAVLFGMARRLPVVVSEHYSGFALHTLPPADIAQARFAFPRARWVLPVSESLQTAIAHYGIRCRSRVVPNAVDPTRFEPRRARAAGPVRQILFVGSLIPLKQVTALIEALGDIARRRRDWHLHVVGDGQLRQPAQGLAAELGIADQVTFHGVLPKATVAERMRQADFLVLPSLTENLPCVLLEAQTTGLPVLATAVGGVPEIVDASCGLVVPPRDLRRLMEGVEQMLDTANAYDPGAIRERSRRYWTATVGAELDAIYRDVTA